MDRLADPEFRADNRRFFEEPLPGPTSALGTPGGASGLGPVGVAPLVKAAADNARRAPRPPSLFPPSRDPGAASGAVKRVKPEPLSVVRGMHEIPGHFRPNRRIQRAGVE